MTLNHESTILEWQQAMEEGKTTSRELTQAFLKRIADNDKQGLLINAISEINPDALHIADAMDRERALTGSRGPLHGISILIKDNIATHDSMHTTAGSLAMADSYASADAFLVSRLRDAGAVLLGKTNLTEWANFISDHMPNGYSSRGGQVLNPYGPGSLDVGGSSAGSGAAIAAGFAVAAVGTETSGSILNPAARNSLVGIKPTVGLISRTGIIPIATSQDTAGPMARTVEDAAILLGVMAGIDAQDPATGKSKGLVPADYRSSLDLDGLRGARIGIVRSRYIAKFAQDEQALYEDAITVLKEAGATVIDSITIPSEEANWQNLVLIHEFKSGLNAYLKTLPASFPLRTLKDIMLWNQQHEEQALRYGQILFEKAEKTSGALTEPEYITTRLYDLEMSQHQGIDAVCNEHNLDCLVFPMSEGASIAARAGYPSVTVPAGYTQAGKPFGIMFTGLAFQESALIRYAYAYEQKSHKRIAPPLLNH
ncbi:amidase [Brevibacillus invocatus]|uniref:Amidase n=1 Tax=Brevibacillus invocatus TaxID=173959 RepID=A0A3M8CHW3_9BACL|nr:amidase family protein [Brevibacillus invocatus]RNB75280.1 amidase [Brevibacillus invocatus]